MKGSINIRYKENNVNGIFRKIAKITKSKNIYRDGFISFYSSSILEYSCYDVLTGTKDYVAQNSWFQTLDQDPDPWITIDFQSLKLTIEGLCIYTNTNDFLPNYEVLVSNDNKTWNKIGSKKFSSAPVSWTQSFAITKNEARFIKLHGIGQRFGGENLRMAIYELDLFGKLSGISLFHRSCQVRRKSLTFVITFIEIIVYHKS